MLDSRRSSGNPLYGYQIEPIVVISSTKPVHPQTCYPDNVPLLSPVHRLQTRAKRERAAGLHFDKRDQMFFSNDQIDLMSTDFETMSFN
jgi:hypothetical protein